MCVISEWGRKGEWSLYEPMFQELKLLDYLYSTFQNVNLSKVALVSCQHLLQSNYITLEYLFRLGLEPQNTFLLGKAYSSNRSVASQLSSRGAHVRKESFFFDSHEGYDVQLERYIRQFIFETASILEERSDIERVIVVDDGGQLISQIDQLTFRQQATALEWTTSGYRKLLGRDIKIPVLNMARSETKLNIESPIIGRGVVEKIQDQYPKLFSSKDNAVVIGAGPIGRAVAKSLEDLRKNVIIIDLDTRLAEISSQYDLIVGCTGESIFEKNDLSRLQDVVLVSASSSDREFSAVEMRRKFPQNHNSHKEYVLGNITLANSGFPINFDGNIQFLPLEKIQITLGMVLAGVCLCASHSYPNGLNNFPNDVDEEITDFFLRLSS